MPVETSVAAMAQPMDPSLIDQTSASPNERQTYRRGVTITGKIIDLPDIIQAR
jgi:hypothetical protein